MQTVLDLVERVAPTDATLLIQGETGTGKELVAAPSTSAGPRAARPFVAVHCGASPRPCSRASCSATSAARSPGAVAARHGRFEVADGGTLFLDEIGEISPRAPGEAPARSSRSTSSSASAATQTITVDVRVIAATQPRPVGEVEGGRFREDLYYRLNVVTRRACRRCASAARTSRSLAEHFLARGGNGKLGARASPRAETLERLLRYAWPGNVRELENAIERAAILARRDTVDPDDLPPHVSAGLQLGPSPQLPRQTTLAETERVHILQTLERFGRNHSGAAEALGIGRTTLWRKLKEYGIDR